MVWNRYSNERLNNSDTRSYRWKTAGLLFAEARRLFAGEDTSYDIKNRIFLDRLEGVPDEERTARFVCAVAAVFPDGSVDVVRETIEGRIAHESAGTHGFGYDPIFYLPEYGCTTAQLSPEQKNEVSHRGKALCAIKRKLKGKIGDDLL